MAVRRRDGRFSLDLYTLYTKDLMLKGLQSGMLRQVEVARVLDYLTGRPVRTCLAWTRRRRSAWRTF